MRHRLSVSIEALETKTLLSHGLVGIFGPVPPGPVSGPGPMCPTHRGNSWFDRDHSGEADHDWTACSAHFGSYSARFDARFSIAD